MSSPMKAKGVGELGICGVGAAVANAIYNETGVRVRVSDHVGQTATAHARRRLRRRREPGELLRQICTSRVLYRLPATSSR